MFIPSSIIPNPVPKRTIGEHGIIGNLKTAALVSLDATVDFMCWPSLDSPTVFAALLDPHKGGEFSLSPQLSDARVTQSYLTATNVLTARWLSVEGSAEVTDLMRYPNLKGDIGRRLIRRVVVTRGRVEFMLRCRPRFDYARIVPQTSSVGNAVVFTGKGTGTALQLSGCAPSLPETGRPRRGLRDAGDHVHDREELDACVRATTDAWQAWAKVSSYVGRWREHVTRSALALKLLVSHEHGSTRHSQLTAPPVRSTIARC